MSPGRAGSSNFPHHMQFGVAQIEVAQEGSLRFVAS
jgi:hypothetical protein